MDIKLSYLFLLHKYNLTIIVKWTICCEIDKIINESVYLKIFISMWKDMVLLKKTGRFVNW